MLELRSCRLGLIATALITGTGAALPVVAAVPQPVADAVAVEILGVEVPYEVHGDGQGVLMVHGFGVDRETMKGCMEPAMTGRLGWRRIYFDLPGMGLTPPVPQIRNSDGMLRFVLAFADAILGEESFLVVGESYGGYLAQGLVHRCPQRLDGLLLICPLVVPQDGERDRPRERVVVQDESLMAELDPPQRMQMSSFLAVHKRVNWQRLQREMLSVTINREYLEPIRGLGYPFSFDVEQLDAPFPKPTLILAGRQDALVGYRDQWCLLPGYPRATYAVLDRAGHALQIEQQQLFEALIAEWLDRVATDRVEEEGPES